MVKNAFALDFVTKNACVLCSFLNSMWLLLQSYCSVVLIVETVWYTQSQLALEKCNFFRSPHMFHTSKAQPSPHPENMELWDFLSFEPRNKSWKTRPTPKNMGLWDFVSFGLRNKSWNCELFRRLRCTPVVYRLVWNFAVRLQDLATIPKVFSAFTLDWC